MLSISNSENVIGPPLSLSPSCSKKHSLFLVLLAIHDIPWPIGVSLTPMLSCFCVCVQSPLFIRLQIIASDDVLLKF